ncbi:hypothetical protein C8F01DRAFT_1262807 [Mycena amicta]|nr:hypothetical protein C8F01DRAFT_1262807 [Mycena amicta]
MSTIFPKRGRQSSADPDLSYMDLDAPPSIPAAEKKRHHSPFSYLRIRKRSTEGGLKKKKSEEVVRSPPSTPRDHQAHLPPVPPLSNHARNYSEPPAAYHPLPIQVVRPYQYPHPPPPPRANSGSDSSTASSAYPPTPPNMMHPFPYIVSTSPDSSHEDLTHSRLATAHALLPAPGPALAAAAILSAAQSGDGNGLPAFSRDALGAGMGMGNGMGITGHEAHGLLGTIAMDRAKVAATVAPLITNGMQNLTKAQTIVDELVASEAWSVVKESAAAVLEPAKDVVVILDSVVKYIPAIMVAESIFSVIIKHELERNENDKHILVVYHTMTVFWFTMCDLQAIFRADHEHIKSALDTFFQDVGKTIQDFGNFREVYYRHGHFTHTLRSSEYRKKLTAFTTAFAQHKSDLHFILSESSALEIHDALGSVGGMAEKLDVVTRQLAVVTAMMLGPGKRTPLEVRVDEAVREGGKGALQDMSFLNQLARDHFGAEEDLDPQIQKHLSMGLDEALSANMPAFSLRVEAAQKDMADALERSTDAILQQLNSGPYQLIKDEDIRTVWQSMNWKISCKARHFVDAVHNHFAQKFGDHTQTSGEMHTDQWTLHVLSQIIYYPNISDAIDDDGSGYISVHEVNHFFKSRPKEWSAPQWIAYWAAGWKQNALTYKDRCQGIFSAIEAAARTVHPDNRRAVKSYIHTSGISELYLVVNSVAPADPLRLAAQGHHSPETAPLDALKAEMMQKETEHIRSRMERIQYQLESPEMVLAVLGTHRLEGFILCVLELILDRHLQILETANSLVINQQEFETMTTSLKNLVTAFGMRYRTLTESWKQQRLDTDFLVESFASGIFNDWHEVFADQQPTENAKSSPRAKHITSPRSPPKTPQEILIFPLPPQPTSPGAQILGSPPPRLVPPHPHGPRRRNNNGRASDYFGQFDFERRPSERPVSIIDPASISELYKTKTKKPKLEDRITTLETELSDIKGMLAQLLMLSTPKTT